MYKRSSSQELVIPSCSLCKAHADISDSSSEVEMGNEMKKSGSVTVQIISPTLMAGVSSTLGPSTPSIQQAAELPGSQFASLLAAIQQSEMWLGLQIPG